MARLLAAVVMVLGLYAILYISFPFARGADTLEELGLRLGF